MRGHCGGLRALVALALPSTWATIALLVFTSGPAITAEESPLTESASAHTIPPGQGRIEEFIGCELPNGNQPYVNVSASDMPWRVAIGMPRNSPKYGSRKEARAAAIAAMREWERAIQTQLPWFVLEFVEKDPKAQVGVKWKRRTAGSAQGRGGPTCWKEDGQMRAGGRMEVAIKSCPTCTPLEVKEVSLLVAHEFGHVLGLGHCLDCDSAMNYSWQTIGRVYVTGTDVEAVVRRFSLAHAANDPSNLAIEADQVVAEAAGIPPIDYGSVSCESLSLERSCSDRKGGRKRKKIDSLKIRFAGSDDGRMLMLQPEDSERLLSQRTITSATNQRYMAVKRVIGQKGIRAVRTTPLVWQKSVVGYLVEYDGDAWSALGF